MSSVFFTSDLHLGHKHVAEIRGFDTYQEHDEWMLDAWNRTIGKKDIVFVLGDIAVDKVSRALALLDGLPGEKHLIAGNHDPAHPLAHRGFTKNFKAFSEVFATVQPMRMRKVNGFPTMLSHFPYAAWGDGGHRAGSRYDEWRLPDVGRPLLHGHTHGTERAHRNMMHVGIDAWGQPVPEAWVAEWLNDFHSEPQAIDSGIPLDKIHARVISLDRIGIPHMYDVKKPILCHGCHDVTMALAEITVKGKKMLCSSCASL